MPTLYVDDYSLNVVEHLLHQQKRFSEVKLDEKFLTSFSVINIGNPYRDTQSLPPLIKYKMMHQLLWLIVNINWLELKSMKKIKSWIEKIIKRKNEPKK